MRRKLIIFLLILSICFLIFSIVSTYARYSSEYEKITTLTLTKWNLLVNNSDISNNTNFTSSLTPVLESNPHIAEGVIVPTSTGYFDIEINSANTDLSFSYTINISNNNSDVLDFKIIGYSKNESEIIPMTDLSITDTIRYSDNIDTTSYRFYIEWDDSDDNITNNLQDAQLAINNSIASFDINISFEQIEDTYNFKNELEN